MPDITMETATAVGTAILIALARAALWLLRNREARAVAGVVAQAGAVAAHYALGSVREGIRRAQDADSDGGETVTPAELRAIIRAAVGVGLDHIDGMGMFSRALAALGGQKAVEDKIVTSVEDLLRHKGYLGQDASGANNVTR